MHSMEAIYQRARPSTFAEVVGQDHVKDILAAALVRGRTGHAYLFSGPRGVGKTTTARLLAMAVNCESTKLDARPCGSCEACQAIRTGSHPDVIELDAASNNSVDDVRELRERVRLASLRGGTRVWILDEAHMLSSAAANALLKTLEEPPPGLLFILATTEPERLPATVLSRCQHFRFRRLSVPEIQGKLAALCKEANVEVEAGALDLVARAADGAMRDAESLLERLWADGGPIRSAAVEDALGLPPRERLERLATALAEANLENVLGEASALYRDGFAPRSVAENLARTLRDAILNDATGEEGFRVPLPRHQLLELLHQFDDELDRFVRHDDLYALEAALLKVANAAHRAAWRAAPAAETQAHEPLRVPAAQAKEHAAARTPAFHAPSQPVVPNADAPAKRSEPSATETGTPPEPRNGSSTTPQAHPSAARSPGGERGGPPSADASDSFSTEPPKRLQWHAVKAAASAQLKAFLQPSQEEVSAGVVTLRYGERHKFHFQQLVQRYDELVELIASNAGPGWDVVLEGPGESVRKKR